MNDKIRTEHVHNWHQLASWGINMLTGESCGYSMRLLCDLTEKGASHIRSFLGGNVEFTPASNWNSVIYTEDGKEDAIASILLPRSIFKDLAAFLLLQDGWQWVISHDTEIVGMNQRAYDEYCRRDMIAESSLRIHNPGASRNTHQMSGRVE